MIRSHAKARSIALGCLAVFGSLASGCSSSEPLGPSVQTTSASLGATGTAAPSVNYFFLPDPNLPPPNRTKKPLAEGTLRAPLFVFPADASVEVDGRPAYRRNGAIDIVAKPGEEVRVRVFKGANERTKTITLQQAGSTVKVLPSQTVDLEEPTSPQSRR